MRPRISVCLVTVRPGGLDVLLAGLKRQTFDDFEVVLVDALYERRIELVGDLFHTAKIPIIHTPPRQRVFPIDAVPQYRNTAIAKARGHLLLWLVDFSFVPAGCLAEHWGVWEHTRGEVAGMGAHVYVYPPSVSYELPDYAPCRMFAPNQAGGITYEYSEEATQAYAYDVAGGFYDKHMYSIFEVPLEAPEQVEGLKLDPYFFQADPKLNGAVGGKLGGTFFHAKNEGVPRSLCVASNGFEEGYTGHLYDDTDFGYRAEHAGLKWMLLDPSANVKIVNPRHFFPHLVRLASTEEHRAVFDKRRVDSRHVRATNPFSLEELSSAGPWWY